LPPAEVRELLCDEEARPPEWPPFDQPVAGNSSKMARTAADNDLFFMIRSPGLRLM